MTRCGLALALSCFALGSVLADPPKIDRTIKKEPVYRTKNPKYGLLALGREGKDRVWLVLDGDVLYVDRNGNGDLTEPGERIRLDQKPGRDPEEEGYGFEVGEVTVGGRTHKGLGVGFVPLKRYAGGSLGDRSDVKAALAKDPKAIAVAIGMDVEVPGLKGGGVGGRVSFTAGPIDLGGVFQFASTPADAPVIRFGGPLQVTFYAEPPAIRVGRESEFVLVVGTPGIGPGTFAMVGYQDTIPETAKPVADLVLPGEKSGVPPVRDKCIIKGRC
jgi:hypothetical protein